jgi:hypothetical protein
MRRQRDAPREASPDYPEPLIAGPQAYVSTDVWRRTDDQAYRRMLSLITRLDAPRTEPN